MLYNNYTGEVNADSLIPLATNDFFHSEILDKTKIVLPYYNFDILYKKDRTLFKKLLEKDFYIFSGEYYTEQESYEYFIENSYKRYLAITNAIIDLATNVEQNCILFIENINKIENGYECKGFLKYDFDNVDYLSLPFIGTPISGNHTLLIIYDGDYINIYEDSRDKLIMTYAITDENTLKEFNNLLKTGSCDLSKVTWPRHADGSCDY